nr:MAG TPA: hypothetical protein [Caudoviricetes sp.]
MDYKRMWMFLEEEVEEEAAEDREFFFLDTLLANMESWEQFEADGLLTEYELKRRHRDVICDYGIAWGILKGRIEEFQGPGSSIDIVDLLELMDDIEYSGLKALFDE